MLLTTTRGLRLLICDGSSSIPSSGFPWHDPSGRREGGSAWGKHVSVYLLSLNCKQRITSSHCPLMGKNGSHSLQVPFRKSKWVGLASSQPLHHALGFAVFKLFSLFLAFLLSPKKKPLSLEDDNPTIVLTTSILSPYEGHTISDSANTIQRPLRSRQDTRKLLSV